MGKLLNIDWAPLSLPVERRLQTLAVLYFCLDYMILGPIYVAILITLLFTPFFAIPIIYSIWWYYDQDACNRGGRKWRPARNWRIFKYARDYFPVSLVKTAELDPNRNYIFAVHPHGVFALSNVFNMCSDWTGIHDLFPGLRMTALTLKENFIMPFHREILLWSGLCSVTRESIEWLLTQEGTGNIINIVPGGAIEATDAVPGTCDLTLKNRKGFVRMALKYGADLVPLVAFGENELYEVTKRDDSSWVRRLQKKCTKVLRFTIPVFRGRGVFQYTFGILPFRTPLTTVIGSPIRVEKTEGEPTLEQVDAMHAKYCVELRKLYDTHKKTYGYEHVPMIIK